MKFKGEIGRVQDTRLMFLVILASFLSVLHANYHKLVASRISMQI
jgi:hypothetical protein